jgi:CIC family chloride channel protein
MTGSYGLLVPALLVGAMAYLFLPIRVSLYENQVPTRIDSPAHREMQEDSRHPLVGSGSR